MLSRLALRSEYGLLVSRQLIGSSAGSLRVCHHQAKQENSDVKIYEGPERDLVNFPRRLRPLYPDKVRLGFIPEEWFQFFYSKTGVTGPYMFGFGLTTYLLSKEIYVMDHEFYNGISLFILAYVAIKKFGPQVAAFADKGIDAIEDSWRNYRNNTITSLKDGIAGEEKSQWSAQGQKVLFDAKRENVQLQLEANYRERMLTVFREVKKRLDFQLEIQNAQRNMEQKHMVNWITNNVVKSITPQQEKEALQKCLADLRDLSARTA